MIKETRKYTDLFGVEVEETCYFHISQAEFIELSAKYDGDIFSYIENITEQSRFEDLINTMQDLILTAYGVKSDDGKRFIKSKELKDEFKQSIFYAELFEDLITNPEKAKVFGDGIATSIRDAVGKAKVPNLNNS